MRSRDHGHACRRHHPDALAGFQFHSLQLHVERLTGDFERIEMVERRSEVISLIAVRGTAERCDIESGVVQEVFQLGSEFGPCLSAVRRSHAAQVEVVLGFRIITRVTSFKELKNGGLRRGAAQRVARRRGGSLR